MPTRAALALAATLLAAPVAAAPARAQSTERWVPRPRFGIVGGVSVTSMTTTRDRRWLTGAYAGGQLVLPRRGYFSLQLEAAWSQKGVQAAGTDLQTGEAIDVTLRNGYVELPILLRLDSPLAIGVHPYGAIPFVIVGPSLGVSVRCTIDATSPDGRSLDYDCGDDFGVKPFDFGAMLGVGLEADVGTRALSLGARTTLGLQGVFEGSGGRRNRAVLVLAGLTF